MANMHLLKYELADLHTSIFYLNIQKMKSTERLVDVIGEYLFFSPWSTAAIVDFRQNPAHFYREA